MKVSWREERLKNTPEKGQSDRVTRLWSQRVERMKKPSKCSVCLPDNYFHDARHAE